MYLGEVSSKVVGQVHINGVNRIELGHPAAACFSVIQWSQQDNCNMESQAGLEYMAEYMATEDRTTHS
jgi:hypothetical protein